MLCRFISVGGCLQVALSATGSFLDLLSAKRLPTISPSITRQSETSQLELIEISLLLDAESDWVLFAKPHNFAKLSVALAVAAWLSLRYQVSGATAHIVSVHMSQNFTNYSNLLGCQEAIDNFLVEEKTRLR